MAIGPIAEEHARFILQQSLKLGPNCVVSTSRFELLRAAVWGLSTPSGLPAHISKVLNATIASWRLLSGRPEVEDSVRRAELRSALDSLVDAGDLVETAGGRWSPAPTRLVELEQEAGWLLVGGAPLTWLPIPPERVEHHGPYRRLQSPATLSKLLPSEAQESWARIPTSSLQDWARGLINSLDPLPYAPSSHESFEFYCPAAAQARAPQFRRWAEEPDGSQGVLLGRRARLFGTKEYRLVGVSGGRITHACELPTSEVRRLMYALDLSAGNPVQARRVSSSVDGTQITLTSEIPRPEQRIFAAIGELTIPLDRPFERRWLFRRDQETAQRLLRALGVEVVDAQPRKTFR